MTSRRFALLRAGLPVLVAAGLAITGCTAIPTSGGVHAAGAQNAVNQDQNKVVVLPQGPVEGETPTDVVDGFRFASADSADLSISRSFLADPTSWQPNEGVRVVDEQSEPATFTPAGDQATVRYVDKWIGTIAADGTYQPTNGDQTVDYTYELAKDAKSKGQWRITNPPPFLILPPSRINGNYNLGYLYFLSSRNDQVLVPVRVFLPVTGTDPARELVLQLLQGPPKWLKDAGVTSAIPGGSQLLGVSQSPEGVVTVDLSAEIASLSPADRDAASAQLVYTLQGYGQGDFKVEASDQPVENSHHAMLQSTKTWSAYDPDALEASQFYYAGADHKLRYGSGSPVPGDAGSGVLKIVSATVAPKLPNSPGPDLLAAIGSEGSTQRLYVGTLFQPKPIDVGASFTTPSWDMFGNVWTVRTQTPQSPQEVRVSPVTQSGTTKFMTVGDKELAASQLIETLRVSRDGTRVAVIAKSAAAGPQLLVGHVVKSASGESIAGFYPVAPSLVPVADGVVWASSTKLEVLATASGASSPSVWSIDVDGWAPTLSQVETPPVDIVAIADAPGQPLVIAAKPGQLEVSRNDIWQVVGAGTAPNYPG